MRTFIKVAATYVVIQRVISVAGNYYFRTQKAATYINEEDNPYVDAGILLGILINIFLTLAIQAPAIYRQFENKDEQKSSAEIKELTHDLTDYDPDSQIIKIENTSKLSCTHRMVRKYLYNPDLKLNKKGISIYLTFKMLGYFTMGFGSLVLAFGSYNLANLLLGFIEGERNETHHGWENAAIIGFELSNVISNIYSSLAFKQLKIEENGIRLSRAIENRELTFDKAFFQTAAIGMPIIASSAFTGFFSTTHALTSLAGLINVTAKPKAVYGLALTSSAVNVAGLLTADLISLMDRFRNQTNDTRYAQSPRWEKPFRFTIYGLGAINGLVYDAVGTTISIVYTSNQVFKTDLYSPYVIIAGGVCGLLQFGVSWNFFIRQCFQDNLNYYHKKMGHVAYSAQNTENILLNPVSNEVNEAQPSDLYYKRYSNSLWLKRKKAVGNPKIFELPLPTP